MITAKIAKNKAQILCPLKAINPAIPIETAAADQLLAFKEKLPCALEFMFYIPQYINGSADFKSVGSNLKKEVKNDFLA